MSSTLGTIRESGCEVTRRAGQRCQCRRGRSGIAAPSGRPPLRLSSGRVEDVGIAVSRLVATKRGRATTCQQAGHRDGWSRNFVLSCLYSTSLAHNDRGYLARLRRKHKPASSRSSYMSTSGVVPCVSRRRFLLMRTLSRRASCLEQRRERAQPRERLGVRDWLETADVTASILVGLVSRVDEHVRRSLDDQPFCAIGCSDNQR